MADRVAGFLGALTAIGMTVVLLLGTVAGALLVARARHADAESVSTTISAHPVAIDVVGGPLLSVMVFAAFSCGGYVAARITGRGGRRTGLEVWWWALPAPVGLVLTVLGAAAGASAVVETVAPDATIAALEAGLAAIALLGALLGADLGQRSAARPADR